MHSPIFSSSPPANNNTQVFVATLDIVGGNAWYLYLGATHHLTNNVASLTLTIPYTSPGKVFFGNGNALPDACLGQLSLFMRSHPFYLCSLLYVPGITKNLLYVSKFTKDNQVLVEFYPTLCQVRDMKT